MAQHSTTNASADIAAQVAALVLQQIGNTSREFFPPLAMFALN
jgi:hypothetical protein